MSDGEQDQKRHGARVATLESAPPERIADEASDSEQELGLLERLQSLRQRRQFRVAQSYALPLALVSFISVICMINHFSGHDWGDDFALYLRQAKALAIGNVGEVISDNRFTVENSGWSTFSPVAYPWGWPLLIAPLYALFGINYEVLKIVEVVAFCLFLLTFFSLVRRRAGYLAATLLVLLIGLSPIYIAGTDSVLSDMPYLSFVGVSLWWMDRCRRQGLDGGVSRRQLVIMGLLVAYSFNVRREGIILLCAFAALHLSMLVGPAMRRRSVKLLGEQDWRKASIPYVTFGLAVVTFHLLLPTMLVQRIPGTGLHNVMTRLAYYQDILAQQIGLEKPGLSMELLGSEFLAERALLCLVTLAMVGLVLRDFATGGRKTSDLPYS